jgi:hypothetical protein
MSLKREARAVPGLLSEKTALCPSRELFMRNRRPARSIGGIGVFIGGTAREAGEMTRELESPNNAVIGRVQEAIDNSTPCFSQLLRRGLPCRFGGTTMRPASMRSRTVPSPTPVPIKLG